MTFGLGVAKPLCSHGYILCTTCLRQNTWRQGVGKIDKRTALFSQAYCLPCKFSKDSGFCGQNQFVCTFGWASSSLWIPKKATILRSFPTYCLFLLIHFLYASWQALLASVLKLTCSQLLARSLQIILDSVGICWDTFFFGSCPVLLQRCK